MEVARDHLRSKIKEKKGLPLLFLIPVLNNVVKWSLDSSLGIRPKRERERNKDDDDDDDDGCLCITDEKREQHQLFTA